MAHTKTSKFIHLLTSPEGFVRYTENNHLGYFSQVSSAVKSPLLSRTSGTSITPPYVDGIRTLHNINPVNSYVLVDTVLGVNGQFSDLESALLDLDSSNLIILHTLKNKIEDYFSLAESTGAVLQVKRVIYNPNDLALLYGGLTPKGNLPSMGGPFVFSAANLKPAQHDELSTNNHAPVILGYLGGDHKKRVR